MLLCKRNFDFGRKWVIDIFGQSECYETMRIIFVCKENKTNNFIVF